MSEPFDAPEFDAAWGAVVGVIGAWMLTGAVLGTVAGVLTDAMGLSTRGPFLAGVSFVLGAGLAGMVAFRVERSRSLARPSLVDARGRRTRPVHAALYLAPIGVALPSMILLGILGSLRTQSPFPAIAAASLWVALVGMGRRLVHGHRVRLALEADEVGDRRGAIAAFHVVAGTWWSSVASRRAAHLSLGMMHLELGELEAAARSLVAVRGGRAETLARPALALVRLLQGHNHVAERLVREAAAGGGGPVVQTQADAVRVLLVWRNEGLEAGRGVGERLLGPGAGGLFLGVLAALRQADGDHTGAQTALAGGVLESLQERGLDQLVPELRALDPS
jgi:hypothetical protein